MPTARSLLTFFSALALTFATPHPAADNSYSPTATEVAGSSSTGGGGEAEKQIDCGGSFSKDSTPFTTECVEAVQGAPKQGDQFFSAENPVRDFTSGKCYAIVGLPHENSRQANVQWADVQFGFTQLMTACSRSGPNKDILVRSAGTLLLGPSQKIRVTLAKPPKERPVTLSATNGTSASFDWGAYRDLIASVSGGIQTDDDTMVAPLNNSDVTFS